MENEEKYGNLWKKIEHDGKKWKNMEKRWVKSMKK